MTEACCQQCIKLSQEIAALKLTIQSYEIATELLKAEIRELLDGKDDLCG